MSTRENVPRLALTQPEAAAALGMSLDSFQRHVAPDLAVIRKGRLRLYPVREIEAWVLRNAARTL